MIVSVDHDNIDCSNKEEFEKTIKEQLSKESAEVWISLNGDTEGYPCLALLVNQDYAALNYFDDDGSCYSSYRGEYERETVYFCDDQYEVDISQIISKESALNVIMDFFPSGDRSEYIQWEQLY